MRGVCFRACGFKSHPAHHRMKKEKDSIPAKPIPHYLIIIAIIVSGFLAYHRSILKGVFLFDDRALILENSLIKNFSYLKTIFTTHLYHGSGSYSNFYRPIQSLSYMLDYHFWNLDPFGYHLMNVLIHIFSAVLVYFLIYLISKNRLIALATGLLFCVNTVLSWPVNYVASRADLLSALFFLAGIVLYVLYRENRLNKSGAFLYLLSIVCFIVAVLSKEAAVILPFVLLLYLYCFPEKSHQERRPAPRLIWVFFLMAGAYIVLRITALNFAEGRLLETTTAPIPLYNRLLTTSKVVMIYLRLLLVPVGLHMEWNIEPARSFLQDEAFLSCVVLLAIGCFSYFLLRTSRLKFFAIAWFFIMLLPYSNIFPLAYFMGEGWLYLPSVGFFALMAIYFFEIAQRSRLWSIIIGAVFIFMISSYVLLTIRRADVWASPADLYIEVLKYSPDNTKARINLGVLLAQKGLDEEALKKYKKVIDASGEKADEAHSSMGSIYAEKGMYDVALEEFKKAVETAPGDYIAITNIGIIYKKKGDFQEAEKWYKRAINVNPNYDLAYNNLGNIYLETARHDDAISYYKKAIELNPHRAPFYENMGKAYKDKGDYPKAREAFEKALGLDDTLKDAKEALESLK